MSGLRAFRGRVVHCLANPGPLSDPAALEYLEDGLLLVRDGHVEALGRAESLGENLSEEYELTHYKDKWILPGFIDCHVHYPQLDIIASYGERLLDWLNTYTYPAEARFADAELAADTASRFLDGLLANGTTSAMVFATVHPESVDAIFTAARARRMRLWSGKVLMDRHCPEELRDSAEAGYRDSRTLLERWHNQDRLQYAITPRFAPTSTPEQLTAAGQLAEEFPDVYVHSHLAESKAEVAWVDRLFPAQSSYVDVYRHAGLMRERSIYAHCLHLEDAAVSAMAEDGAAMAFCPSSNLFLGSGLFDFNRADLAGINVGLGTDVGGGTSLNMLRTIADGYKVLQLRGQPLSPLRALYLSTLGAAKALCADDRIGNFEAGKEADFVVLDPAASPVLQQRLNHADTLAAQLFAMMILGDDRLVYQTCILGEPALPVRG
ncbi:MAG: guanine deaminase [Gammaproteobacteria bacterium]|nr:guanine deaminase [Gammaproteobacteria bacterium]NNF60414.1 guanine deaminase [Gammaproteobacteria bacterium]NNM20658.1 guanine deaminase [Gammaproteobacteria bacterium]